MTASTAIIFTVATIIYIFLTIGCSYAITENSQYKLSRVLTKLLGGIGLGAYMALMFYIFSATLFSLGFVGLEIAALIFLICAGFYLLLFSFGQFLYDSTHTSKTDQASNQA